MLGSQDINEINHTSSTGTIEYMEPQESREPTESIEPTEPEYIPQNITMEICDRDVDVEPTSQDNENISII